MNTDEIVRFLKTMRTAIVNDMVPELTSSHVKAEAGSLVMTLNNFITRLGQGDVLAHERQAGWQRVSAELAALGFRPEHGASQTGRTTIEGSYDGLEAQVRDIQRAIRSDDAFERLTAKLAARDSSTEAWYARAVAAALDFSEACEPQVLATQQKVASEPVVDEVGRLRAGLAAYLRKRFPSLPEQPITSFRIAPGGHVKQTSIFELVPNAELPTNLVLRRDLPNSITGTSVADEYPVMERAFALGLPVAKPILLEADAAVLDGRFMIMTEITDAVGAGTYFPEERRYAPRTTGPEFGNEVAQFLARLHSGTKVGTAGAGSEQTDLVRKNLEAWRKLPQQPFSMAAELAFAWLLSHPLAPNRPRCLIHGDVGAHNILVRDGRLAAVLDWELAQVEDPAIDLAQCRMMLLPDTMPWEEFARHYVAAGGDPVACDAAAVAYFCVWTYIKHGVMNATVRDMYLRGERDDPIAASIAGHYFHRLMQYEARALQIAVDAGRGS